MSQLSGSTALQKHKRPSVSGNEVQLVTFKKEHQDLLENSALSSQGSWDLKPLFRKVLGILGAVYKTLLFPIARVGEGKGFLVCSLPPPKSSHQWKRNKKLYQAKTSLSTMRNQGYQNGIWHCQAAAEEQGKRFRTTVTDPQALTPNLALPHMFLISLLIAGPS